jgi:DNA-binding CsgD family transcriptional regulator
MRSKTTRVDRDELLTKRQKQIVLYIADELSPKEIGEKLGISTRTVKFHKRYIRKKLGVRGVAGWFGMRSGSG